MLNDLYFKTICNIRPQFLGPMGGLIIEGPLYSFFWGGMRVFLADNIKYMCICDTFLSVNSFLIFYN